MIYNFLFLRLDIDKDIATLEMRYYDSHKRAF